MKTQKITVGKNPQNKHFIGRRWGGKVFTQPSQTIPDEAVSIRELFVKQAAGIPIQGTLLEPTYGTGGLDPRKLDYQELHEAKRTAQKQFYENKKLEIDQKTEQFKQLLRDQILAEEAAKGQEEDPSTK